MLPKPAGARPPAAVEFLQGDASEPPVLRHRRHADVVPLTDPALWGKEISDERYLILSRS